MAHKMTESTVAEAASMRLSGMSLREISQIIGFSPATISKHLSSSGSPERAKVRTTTACWVINHPYQNLLHEPERKRYLEVIHRRQQKNPLMGWDYRLKKQVTFTECNDGENDTNNAIPGSQDPHTHL